MRNWSYGINGLHKSASINLEEAPFYMFILKEIFDFIDSLILPIPLPKIKMKLKDLGDIEANGEEWTTWHDWYGDLSQLFWVYVYDPFFQWYNKKIDEKVIDIPYRKLRKLFYAVDKKFWDKQEEIDEVS